MEKEDSVMKSGNTVKRKKGEQEKGVGEGEKGSYRHLVESLINGETLLRNEWNMKEGEIWGGTKVSEYVHATWSLLGPTKTKTISSCHAKTNATASEIIHLAKCIYIIMIILSQEFLKVFLR